MRARLELAAPSRPAGTVTITNDGDAAVRLWQPGNSWGDDSLTFESPRARYVREADYTRNVPSAVDVPPGGEHELPFDLEDGTWSGGAMPGPGTTLVAVYDVLETPEAAEQGVWRGSVRSDPVAL